MEKLAVAFESVHLNKAEKKKKIYRVRECPKPYAADGNNDSVEELIADFEQIL
jgi:hypothetical protein